MGRFPITKLTAWLGNSVAMDARHYISPLDARYRLAVENALWKGAAKADAICSQNAAPPVSAGICKDLQFGG